jgi:amino acid transporter
VSSGTNNNKIGYWGVVAIGVGGMVGGGIFAVLGLSVQLAHGASPVAFLIAGGVALVTAYSYTCLSVALPSQGGTVTFLDRAFGPGFLTGSVNVLLWISYVVMLSLYSYAFGSYGAGLFSQETHLFWKHALTSGSIVVITGLNLLSVKAIGEAEEWVVAIKVAILLLFIAIGVVSTDVAHLSPAAWPGTVHIVAGGMIIFLAYEGFELIANAAQDVRNPAATLPRAYYSAVGFVIVLYVLVAAVTVGNLSIDQIVAAKDYALAEAARPFLGQTGYLVITIAALLSTASAINATLYGSARLSYIIAKDGELPQSLERKIWNKPVEGLLLTAVLTLLVANLFDLSSISTMGSTGFLLIFAAVNAANAKLANETGGLRSVATFGAVLCLGALASLIWQTAVTAPSHLWVLVAMVGLAVLTEGSYRLFKGRTLRISHLVQQSSSGAGKHRSRR